MTPARLAAVLYGVLLGLNGGDSLLTLAGSL